MDNLIDHIASGLAVILAAVAAWFARKSGKHTARSQRLKDIITKACDAGTANKQPGTPLAKTCVEYAILLDLEDKKRDFTDQKLRAEVDAELARRAR
jgi:hypothetical protein